mmetsp:Transcript_8049/g.19796  ORF Transcript_8049/g.19796 Transcript_8049/m.19796 type:complete len:405 (-) Transcript_8049:313-1527(-)
MVSVFHLGQAFFHLGDGFSRETCLVHDRGTPKQEQIRRNDIASLVFHLSGNRLFEIAALRKVRLCASQTHNITRQKLRRFDTDPLAQTIHPNGTSLVAHSSEGTQTLDARKDNSTLKGREQLCFVEFHKGGLFHRKGIRPVSNLPRNQMHFRVESRPGFQKLLSKIRPAPNFGPHLAIVVIDIPTAVVFKGHAERGVEFQRNQDVSSLGRNDPRMGGQFRRHVGNGPVHHVLVLVLFFGILLPGLQTHLVFLQIQLHHAFGQFKGIRVDFSVVDPHQKGDRPVLHQQHQGVQDGQNAQNQRGGKLGRIFRGNPHVLGQRIQDGAFLVLFLFGGQLFNVHVHPVQPSELFCATVRVVDVRKGVFQFRSKLGGSLHDLEALAVGLFEKFAVGLSNGRGHPQELVDI